MKIIAFISRKKLNIKEKCQTYLPNKDFFRFTFEEVPNILDRSIRLEQWCLYTSYFKWSFIYDQCKIKYILKIKNQNKI